MEVSVLISDAKTFKPIVGRITVLDGAGNAVLGPFPSSTTHFILLVDLQPDNIIKLEANGHESTSFEVADVVNGGEYDFALEPTSSNLLPIVGIAAAGLYFANRNKKRVGKLTTGDAVPWAAVGVGVLGFSLLRQLLEKLGIWDSADTKELNTDATDPGSPWNPNYWRNFTTYTYAITQSTGNSYAKEIYDAFGAFNDCEECAKAVFKRLRTKANVSFVVWCFSNLYGQDLLNFLRGGFWPQDRLSDADVNEINNYIKNLPNS